MEFGPKEVLLEPEEEFTCMKMEETDRNHIRTKLVRDIIAVHLGPDVYHDKIQVRTCDNVDLELKLNYNWCVLIVASFLCSI